MSNSSSVFHRGLIDASGVDNATGFSREGQDVRFRVILNRCLRTSIRGKKVLDYGCNVGGLLDQIWPNGVTSGLIDYTGVDLVTEFLVRLKEKHPPAKTFMGTLTDDEDFECLKIQAPYDYVIASGAFCYLDQWQNHPLMLQRLWELTGDTMVVNFLGSYTETVRKTSKITHCLYHPEFGVKLAALLNCRFFVVFRDYRENDFTVALYRNPA